MMDEREKTIRDNWPRVTAEDMVEINDLFQHYIFFRHIKGDRLTIPHTEFFTSCCGQHVNVMEVARIRDPQESELLFFAYHDCPCKCPLCGRQVRMKDLSKTRKRKNLFESHLVMLLHADGEALYADALSAWKNWEREEDLCGPACRWCASGYRFALGEVMQIDYQVPYPDGYVTWETGKLGRNKNVTESFKIGSIGWYHYDRYRLINRAVLEEHPVFRYSQYFTYAARYVQEDPPERVYGDLISYLTAYCIYPRQIEMLVKAGLFQPVTDLIERRKRNAASMNWDEPDPCKAFGMDRREIKILLEKKPGMEILALRNFERRNFKKQWDIDAAIQFYGKWGEQALAVLQLLKKYKLHPDRFQKYIDEQQFMDPDIFRPMEDLFPIYSDYLEMAYMAGYCMEHSAVIWPEDLYKAHDQANADAMARETSGAWDAVKGGPSHWMERKKKYEFELDGLRIVFPMQAWSIKREGQWLHHCVGGYAKRHMSGVLTILFLRRAENPTIPYVTIEMNGNRIMQIHGYRNDIGAVSPRDTHAGFLNVWLEWLKKGSKRNEDGTPKLPKKKGAAA